jgi:hypothetical protein
MALFLLGFSLDVRVHAAVLQQPAQCLQKETKPCAIFARSGIYTLKGQGWSFRLQEGGAVTLINANRIRLVTGRLDVTAKANLLVETLYGDVAVQGGEALLDMTSKAVKVFGLSDSVKYRPRGADDFSVLAVGFQQSMGRVDHTGVAVSGYGSPAVTDQLVPLWSGFYSKNEINLLKDRLKAFQPAWHRAVEAAGPWYKETAQRQIASLEEQRRKERQRREALLKDQQFYREMFRRRNFME